MVVTAFCHPNFVKSGPQLWTQFRTSTIVDFLPKDFFSIVLVLWVIMDVELQGSRDRLRTPSSPEVPLFRVYVVKWSKLN